MSNDLDSVEGVLDELDFGEFEEALRPLRTPPARSSFSPRMAPTVASQGQVQAAARSLDSKIDTLSAAVKALENRTTAIAGKVDRTASALAHEVVQRKKSEEAIRGDVQQTRMLSMLLPMLNQKTVPAVDSAGVSHEVVTVESGGVNSILPLLLLMPGMTGGDGQKGLLGGDMITTLLLVKMLDK